MSEQEKAPEESGSWFNWWPAPVVTSGAVLGAVGLVLVSLTLGVVGLVLFLTVPPFLAVLSFGAAAASGWAAYRLLRSLL